MELIILTGLQASGKSTFARSCYAEHVYVSKDAMRNVPHKGVRQEAMIRRALAQGESVIVDSTNPSTADRALLIALGREYGARIIGYYFSSHVKECLERNRRRNGKERVPDIAIHAFRRRLEIPSYAEGFDQLFFVTLDEQRQDFVIVEWHEGERS